MTLIIVDPEGDTRRWFAKPRNRSRYEEFPQSELDREFVPGSRGFSE